MTGRLGHRALAPVAVPYKNLNDIVIIPSNDVQSHSTHVIGFSRPENGGQYCSGQSTRIRSCEDNPVSIPTRIRQVHGKDVSVQACKDPMDMFRQRQCSVYNNRTIDPLLPIGVRFEPKYNGKRAKRPGRVTICKRLDRVLIKIPSVSDVYTCLPLAMR